MSPPATNGLKTALSIDLVTDCSRCGVPGVIPLR